MNQLRRAILPLRAMLVLLFGILIVLGTLSLPGLFSHMARESPDLAYLRWPLTAASVASLLMLIMRSLLRQATSLRTEMEAVI